MLTVGQCATLACLWEVSAPKPGNVHRGADFDDVTFEDFVTVAVAIGPAFERAQSQRVGQTILQAVEASRRLVKTNCNLGMILLFAPPAAVPRSQNLNSGIASVLSQLNAADAADIYSAIQLAQPGGMGKVDEHDVQGAPPTDILSAMQLAADRDDIAREYVTRFSTVLGSVVPWLREGFDCGWPVSQAIVHAHVRLMAQRPDTLIGRKSGPTVARESAARAAAVLETGPPFESDYCEALADLDFWLRSDGRRRNPGTTADLIAAGLFCLLRDGLLLPAD